MGKNKRKHRSRFGADKVTFCKVTNKYMTQEERGEAARQANRILKAELSGEAPEPEPQVIKTYGQILKERQQAAEEVKQRVTPPGKTFPEYMREIQERRRKFDEIRNSAK